MIEIKCKDKCSGCTACANICPKNAIFMQYDEEGFIYPKVDKEKCVNCGLCDNICPVLNKLKINDEHDFPIVYACYNKDNNIRKISSSGGIFYLLAEYILKNNGVVVGAAFDDDFGVFHKKIESMDDLPELLGSKYAQSELRNIYKTVKEDLLKDRQVLFSGTSCQVAGLKSYLKKDYSNLICIDLICMGIPSNIIWKQYVKNYKNPENIYFKDKTYGWDCFSIKVKYKNKQKVQVGRLNDYMQLFFKGINIRPICYKCPFRGKHRYSDFTLSDAWGIEEFAEELNDNLGTSSVMIHSFKAKKIFDEIKERLEYKEITFEQAVKNNRFAIETIDENVSRSNFFRDYLNKDKKYVIKKYSKTSLKYKFKIKLSALKRKYIKKVK